MTSPIAPTQILSFGAPAPASSLFPANPHAMPALHNAPAATAADAPMEVSSAFAPAPPKQQPQVQQQQKTMTATTPPKQPSAAAGAAQARTLKTPPSGRAGTPKAAVRNNVRAAASSPPSTTSAVGSVPVVPEDDVSMDTATEPTAAATAPSSAPALQSAFSFSSSPSSFAAGSIPTAPSLSPSAPFTDADTSNAAAAAALPPALPVPFGIVLPFPIRHPSEQDLLARILRPSSSSLTFSSSARLPTSTSSSAFSIDYVQLDAWMDSVESDIASLAQEAGVAIN
jgi:hypothetical protein